eukprot:2247512-Pyramimonas_sp.AAC.1
MTCKERWRRRHRCPGSAGICHLSRERRMAVNDAATKEGCVAVKALACQPSGWPSSDDVSKSSAVLAPMPVNFRRAASREKRKLDEAQANRDPSRC